MKKIIDKRIVLTNLIVMALGFVAGIVFLVFVSRADKLLIKEELEDYLNIISLNDISKISYLLNSFKYNMIYISLISVFSIVYILSPFVLFISFYKGMLVGFLMSSLIYSFKLKGIIYSLLVIFPHHILMNVLVVIYGSVMLMFSYKLLRGTIKKENINLNLFIKKTGLLYLSALVLCFLITLTEIYVSPLLVRLVY